MNKGLRLAGTACLKRPGFDGGSISGILESQRKESVTHESFQVFT